MEPKEVTELLTKNGCRGLFIPFHRLESVKDEIRELHRKGLLEKRFYNEWMPTYLDARLPRSLPRPKSILLVACPNSQRKVTFHLKGKEHSFIVPPTYGTGPRIARRLKEMMKDDEGKIPFKMVNAYPPLKLLAVRSGLAMYGRNNITYVPGFGSFHRLAAFYTDIEAPEGHWGEKQNLPKCGSCKACLSACPTGAISDDRFLLRADRCITCMNERKSDQSFPKWVRPESHNAIVGCMVCQRACPYNRDFKNTIVDGATFSEEETEYLLKGKYSGRKAANLRGKLARAGLDLSVFPRNLKVLLDRSSLK